MARIKQKGIYHPTRDYIDNLDDECLNKRCNNYPSLSHQPCDSCSVVARSIKKFGVDLLRIVES